MCQQLCKLADIFYLYKSLFFYPINFWRKVYFETCSFGKQNASRVLSNPFKVKLHDAILALLKKRAFVK
jgi:hypothetical protein